MPNPSDQCAGPPEPESSATPNPSGRKWRPAGAAVRLTSALLLLILIAGLLGQLIRDRWVVTALLMYIPLPPVGLLLALADLACGGRTVRRPRFAVAAVALLSAVLGALPLLAWGGGRATAATGTPITLLQWNVRWGGTGGEAGWQSLAADVRQRRPDIVVLSEAPNERRTAELLAGLGPTWSSVRMHNPPRSRYLYQLVVASHWPVLLERQSAIHTGVAMQVTVLTDRRTLRLLVVDGESQPTLPRTPRLADVMDWCRQAEKRGQPIDLIAGDFNAVGRSIGFDQFTAAGYRRASDAAVGWRGTYPAWCPLYDIDHVWVGSELQVSGCAYVSNWVADHRGHVVRLNVP